VRLLLVILVAFVSLPFDNAFAQSTNGSVRGIVFDPDGRSIAGAEVIVVNDETRVQFTTTTNREGLYAVENIPPGPYRIQVSKFGFKTIVKPDLILNVQSSLVLNFTMPLGASMVTVTVEGGAPMLNTTDASVSTVVDRQFAENLPMNGRSFQTLIDMTPGVVVSATNSLDNGQFSVNGQRAAANYWMVDGVSANVGVGVAAAQAGGNGLGGTLGGFSALGGTNSLVSVDAMQEFRIQTSTFAPEFGRTPGGQISIVTRSGTNDWHGTAFDYLRNDLLDASNWFNGYTNNPPLPKAEERQNDFGGTLAGPIRKDQTFFFLSYEGLRLRLPQTTLSTVPDLAARQNAVAAMQPYLNAYPLPNGPDDVATGIAQSNASYSNPASLDAYSLRVDHKLNNDWSVFGRYNYSPSSVENRGASGAAPLSQVSTSSITTQTGTVAATAALSPRSSNDLRFNYSRTGASAAAALDSFGGAVPLEMLPFPDGFDERNGRFSFAITSLTAGSQYSVGLVSRIVQRQINLVDGFSLQRGSHTLKFGVDYRRLWPELAPAEYRQSVNFRTVATATQGMTRGGGVASVANPTFLFRNLGLYAQDTWHALPRLTVTYGLRWDVDWAPSTIDGPNITAVTGYSPSDLSNLAIAPAGTPPFQTTYRNFAPRLGAAYELRSAPEWQTVLRAGAGVFYDLASSEAGNLLASTFPPLGLQQALRNVTFPYTAAQTAPPVIPATASLADVFAFNPNLKLPYTIEWNAAIEQSFGKNQVLSVSYLGASGRRLLQTTYFSSPPSNPDVAVGEFVDNAAESSYHALQVEFRRRVSRGLQVLGSYTWSHSIDTASAGSVGNVSNSGGANSYNRGSSDFDIRNAMAVGLTYQVPAPRASKFAKAILGGWSVDSLILVRSAPPVDISDVNFDLLDSGVSVNIRPDIVPEQPFYLYGSSYPGGKALNPAAFTDPPIDPSTGNPQRQGNLSRNALRGFGATQWDLATHRDFSIHESLKLQLRTEFFNVLNHPNFGQPNNQFGTGGFGLSTEMLGQYLSGGVVGGGGFSSLYQIGGPRSVQVALKLIF